MYFRCSIERHDGEEASCCGLWQHIGNSKDGGEKKKRKFHTTIPWGEMGETPHTSGQSPSLHTTHTQPKLKTHTIQTDGTLHERGNANDTKTRGAESSMHGWEGRSTSSSQIMCRLARSHISWKTFLDPISATTSTLRTQMLMRGFLLPLLNERGSLSRGCWLGL